MLENYVMPLPFVNLVAFDAGSIDLDQAAADVARFIVPFKCSVYRAGLLIFEVCAGSTPGVVKFDKRPTLASDTSRGDGDIADFKCGTTAAGKFLWDAVAVGTVLEVGQEVICEITTRPVTGASGHFLPVLLVNPLSETKANMTAAVETA